MFYLNDDFLDFIEKQGSIAIPSDLEQVWQLRRNFGMDDMFWAMYSWIKQDKATREGYRDWLKMVKIWYSKLL